jgi:hypothetical protein
MLGLGIAVHTAVGLPIGARPTSVPGVLSSQFLCACQDDITRRNQLISYTGVPKRLLRSGGPRGQMNRSSEADSSARVGEPTLAYSMHQREACTDGKAKGDDNDKSRVPAELSESKGSDSSSSTRSRM